MKLFSFLDLDQNEKKEMSKFGDEIFSILMPRNSTLIYKKRWTQSFEFNRKNKISARVFNDIIIAIDKWKLGLINNEYLSGLISFYNEPKKDI